MSKYVICDTIHDTILDLICNPVSDPNQVKINVDAIEFADSALNPLPYSFSQQYTTTVSLIALTCNIELLSIKQFFNFPNDLEEATIIVVLYHKQKATCPEVLYDDVVEVRERVVLVQEKSELELPDESFLVTGVTREKVKLDEEA